MSPLTRVEILFVTLAVTGCLQVQASVEKRISHIKCDAYQESFNCSKTVDLIEQDVKAGEFPHQALLGWNKRDGTSSGYDFHCGGTLISELFVLTAAHCMSHGDPNIVRLGETDLTVESGDEWDAGIKYVKRHPEHLFRYSYHDIALIMLNETIVFTAYIRPACLWRPDMQNDTSSVILTGFGASTFGSSDISLTLRKVQIDFINRSECERLYRRSRKFPQGIKDSQLCIGKISEGGSHDACDGDGGGPVQIVTEPRGCTYHVLGITSMGIGCETNPSIYTRVASYIDWIEETVWGER